MRADDRRIARCWFGAAGGPDEGDRFDDCLIRVGRTSAKLAAVVLGLVVGKFAPGLHERLLWGLDDSPTARYGPHVAGAGVPHHPTPGPADGEWLEGHNGVCLAGLATPPWWGLIVVSRLRKGACRAALPEPPDPHRRGRHRLEGTHKISWAKRAAHPPGWETRTYFCRGVEVTRQDQTFLATSRGVSGKIRVVILRFEDGGGAPDFWTDTAAEVRDMLAAVAARWSIEEHFHDGQEVGGVGQQQVRHVGSNSGCWNVHGWLYTLVE